MLNPVTTFDCLHLAMRLQRQIGGFTTSELQLLSYLACLLWIYSGRPQADWGYSYVGTELGVPFSVDVNTTTAMLVGWGYFRDVGDHYEVTPAAGERLADLSEQQMYSSRLAALNAAGASTLAYPIGVLRDALGQEPELKRAKQVPGSRQLLDDAALDELYSQFRILREALGDRPTDLRASAVTWLAALFTTAQSAEGPA